MSSFWLRVDEELEYLGKNRTYLAEKCDFSLSNFNLGIKRNSTPSADTAVKIASVLGVSVEYLVTGENKATQQNQENEQSQLRLYRKYHELINDLETLPQNKFNIVKNLAAELSKDIE